MTEQPLYQRLAQTMQAIKNCCESGHLEWRDKHANKLKRLIEFLPHGSGIDSDWHYSLDCLRKFKGQRMEFSNSFHRMNNVGMYDGWIDFTVVIKPDLVFGIVVNVRGRFSKLQDIHDYLEDSMECALSQTITKEELEQ